MGLSVSVEKEAKTAIMKRVAFFLLFFCACGPAFGAGKVVADLSDDFVAVSEGFDGYRLTVFGAVRGASDIALVVEGPNVDARVRRKNKAFGIWINGEPVVLENVPSFYAVATSRPVEEMISPFMAAKYKLGTQQVVPNTQEGAGFLQVRKNQGLYQDLPKGVRIMDWKLFRADVHLPSNVPIGAYKAHIYEFINGHLFASRTSPLTVGQVGLGERVSRMAHDKPLTYAVFSLALALGLGGAAAYAFRKAA